MSKKMILAIAAVIIIIGGIILFPKIMLFLSSRATTVNAKQIEFFISSPTSVDQLASELKKAGVIDDESGFIEVANYKGLTKEKIALGKYLIDPGTQYRTILNGFTMNSTGNGNGEVEVDVTFNNCRDIFEMAGKACHNLMMDSSDLITYLEDPAVMEKFGFTREQFPAMFLPNTYKMYYDTDEKQFVQRMADEYKNFWTQERKHKLSAIGLDVPSEAVTLASIVYSEQGRNPSEWPVIAGLYLNRLDQGIKLQSDPTFKFCWGKELDGVQRLLNVHRDIDCPYNTYKINGLPPGPICIPPTGVVDAVLNRKKHDYIFMMAKPDYTGLHDFSVDYATHQRYAAIYQKWLANELKNQ